MVGASAGGVDALSTLFSDLPPDIPINEAQCSDMPRNRLAQVEVDYWLPVREIRNLVMGRLKIVPTFPAHCAAAST